MKTPPLKIETRNGQIFSFGNTILDLDKLHDLRHILKLASQSAQYTHRERATAMDLIVEIDDMVEDLSA